ncbi:MAG: D-alanyl-D-alanine carboxypeptidase [Clostridia bacterium]|nr:D-alanyl-D-alanine carboxypeptidase [Clostridia bacterium]
MKKRIFCIFFAIIIFCVTTLSVSAFTPTGFEVSARNGILISYDTGESIYEKDADTPVNFASLSMVMSALVIAEKCDDLDSYSCEMTLDVKKRYLGTGLAVINLTRGGKYSVRELLSLALVGSYSDALYLAAISVFGDEASCIMAMNEKAVQLGLTNTVFADLNGLSEQQYSTARELATIFRNAYQNTDIAEMLSTRSYTLSANAYREKANENFTSVSFSNTCMIINPQTAHFYNKVKAGKTGSMTASGRCIVTLANHEGNSYICVLLGEPTNNITTKEGKSVRPDFYDTKSLYNWVINDFTYREVVKKGDIITEVEVGLSKDNQYLTLAAADGLYATLPKNSDNSTVTYNFIMEKEVINAPVTEGEKLGYAEVYYSGEHIGNIDLVATNSIESSFFAVLGDTFKRCFESRWFKVFSTVLGIMVGIVLTISTIMAVRRRVVRSKKVHKNNY